MIRIASAALAVLLATPALAQGSQPYPPQPSASGTGGYPATTSPPQAPPPAPQGYAPAPQGYAPAPQQGYAPPPAQPQQAPPPRYPEAQSVAPQGTYQQPPPSAGGTGSQQVVVNPPAAPPPQPAAPPPAPAAVTVNPPPAATGSAYSQSQPMVIEREAGRPPLETVAIGAAYGGLAGIILGAGVALIEQGDNWGRDLTVGAGAGILVGGVVGGIQAYNQSERTAMDGLGSPERDRLAGNERRTMFALGGRF